MSGRELRLDLLKSAVEYLDSNGSISNVKILCKQYKQIQVCLIFKYTKYEDLYAKI